MKGWKEYVQNCTVPQFSCCPMTTGELQESGRAQLIITKDTTLRMSLGVLIAIVLYAGIGTWQFFELRAAEKERVNSLINNINTNAVQYAAATNQQLTTLTSDLNYTTRTLEGYKSRTDRLDENLQEIRLLRHRLDQAEQHGAASDRRLQAFEARIEEVHRKSAEHSIVIDYLLRWLNGTPEPPKKRNEIAPFQYGEDRQNAESVLPQ